MTIAQLGIVLYIFMAGVIFHVLVTTQFSSGKERGFPGDEQLYAIAALFLKFAVSAIWPLVLFFMLGSSC